MIFFRWTAIERSTMKWMRLVEHLIRPYTLCGYNMLEYFTRQWSDSVFSFFSIDCPVKRKVRCLLLWIWYHFYGAFVNITHCNESYKLSLTFWKRKFSRKKWKKNRLKRNYRINSNWILKFDEINDVDDNFYSWDYIFGPVYICINGFQMFLSPASQHIHTRSNEYFDCRFSWIFLTLWVKVEK